MTPSTDSKTQGPTPRKQFPMAAGNTREETHPIRFQQGTDW